MNLQPSMGEYANDAQFNYWMDYACELDTITMLIQNTDFNTVEYINKQMKNKMSSKPEHHACCDAASCFEEQIPELKGAFVYE